MKIDDIDFNCMVLPNRMVYEWFGKNEFVRNNIFLLNTPFRGVSSRNSFIITDGGKIRDENYKIKDFSKKEIEELKAEKLRFLNQTFSIDSPVFDRSFYEAVSGSGQEYLRITTMHSSSLCGLLHFFNLKGKTILINLDNLENEKKQLKVEGVRFEFQNPVISSKYPSNIDIVLYGIYDGKKILLFLESKFSEYLNRGTCNIQKSYVKDHEKTYGTNKIVNKYIRDELKKDGYTFGKDNHHYYCGLKQMVSHYIGVRNYIEKKHKSKPIDYEYEKAYLGTVLFDFGELGKDELIDYGEEYKKLIKELQALDNRIQMVPEVLTYQLIFAKSKLLETDVEKYYGY